MSRTTVHSDWRNRLGVAVLAAVLAFATLPLYARNDAPAAAATAVPGVDETYLQPDFWIARLAHPDRALMSPVAIAARNARLMRTDGSMHDLQALPAILTRTQVLGWIEGLAERPRTPLFDASGAPVPGDVLDRIVDNRNLAGIPQTQETRYGLVVERAPLRRFPTARRVFTDADTDTDIDRFQETGLFPGTPVVIAHESGDGQWWFVVSPRYAAWVAKQAIAVGTKPQVLGYAAAASYRLVTGAAVRTVFTPEEPRLSELRLDMGVRMPLADLPRDQAVNGQHPYTSWTVRLPVREPDGKLAIVPALLQKTADTSAENLPLTQANILRQAFKFLGERYGWGHDDDGRDCSGFVSEVYRSMGVLLPRNTGAQAASPALDRRHFGAQDGPAGRTAALDALQVGDLVYLPGHVMLVIGRIGKVPYVIHDIHDGKILDSEGRLRSLHLNAVAVTPLTTLRIDATHGFVEEITDIVRIGRRHRSAR